MSDPLPFDTLVFSKTDCPKGFESQWVELFASCYGTKVSKAREVFQKYQCNDAWFCSIFSAQGSLVACYSGVEVDCAFGKLLVSTDTMSDGVFRNATKFMAEALYQHLQKNGIAAVCGYPNDNIRTIRQRKLGWTIIGELFCWVGIPLISSNSMGELSKGLWQIRRPESGLFTGKRRGLLRFVRIVTRDRAYGPIYGIPFTLAAYRPGPFFVRVPSFVLKPKTFGYKTLRNHKELVTAFSDATNRLDIDTIDLP